MARILIKEVMLPHTVLGMGCSGYMSMLVVQEELAETELYMISTLFWTFTYFYSVSKSEENIFALLLVGGLLR
jgi:hypothetical protein